MVNIRKSDSETADSLGRLRWEMNSPSWRTVPTAGPKLIITARRPLSNRNSWKRFPKNLRMQVTEMPKQETKRLTQIILIIPPIPIITANTDNTTHNGQADTPGAGDGAPSANVPNSGTYRLTTTVNVRKSASETADRLGVGYSGDEVEILMKQADWLDKGQIQRRPDILRRMY